MSESKFVAELIKLCKEYNIAGFLIDAHKLVKEHGVIIDSTNNGIALISDGKKITSFYNADALLEIAGIDFELDIASPP